MTNTNLDMRADLSGARQNNWAEDWTSPRVRAPWRRFFARSLDMCLYTFLWNGGLLLLGKNILNLGGWWDVLGTLVVMGLMLVIEPLLLSRSGTTVGKWALGFRVTDRQGEKLTYRDAVERTGWVLVKGMGLNIPVYNLVRLWKSCNACVDGQELYWEQYTVLTLRDRKAWRILLLIVVYLAVLAGTTAAVLAARLPDHRGEITVAQFCENYNQMAEQAGVDKGRILGPDGRWVKAPTADGSLVLDDSISPPPTFEFTEENGVMTGLHFSMPATDAVRFGVVGTEETILAVQAFVMAQKEYNIFSDAVANFASTLQAMPASGFSGTMFGVALERDFEMVLPAEEGKLDTLVFSMEKVK